MIDRLAEIKDKYGNTDVEVTTMAEYEVDGRVIQFESDVTGVAAALSRVKGVDKGCSRVIVIGQELLK